MQAASLCNPVMTSTSFRFRFLHLLHFDDLWNQFFSDRCAGLFCQGIKSSSRCFDRQRCYFCTWSNVTELEVIDLFWVRTIPARIPILYWLLTSSRFHRWNLRWALCRASHMMIRQRHTMMKLPAFLAKNCLIITAPLIAWWRTVPPP